MQWSTLKAIEYIQRECLKRDNIPEAEWLKKHNHRWSTTKYQDSSILAPIMLQYDELSEQIAKSCGSSNDFTQIKKILDQTIFSTANIYPLNGICFHDSGERYGVLLQEGLRFWPLIMAVFAHTGLFNDDNSKTSKAMLGMRSIEFHSIDRLIALIIKDLTSPYTLYPQGLIDYFMGSDETTKTTIHWIIRGFHSFLLSHELAHIAHGHAKDDHSWVNSIPSPSPNFIKLAIDEANNFSNNRRSSNEFNFHLKKYSSHYSYIIKKSKALNKKYRLLDVTPELKDNLKRQYMETHADSVAFQCIWNMLLKNGYHQDILLSHFIGVACFFWYQEYLERIQAILIAKDSNAVSSMLSNTRFAQNLFERYDHPAPLTRFEKAVHMLSNSENAETGKLLMSIWEDVSILFGGAWDQYAIPYLEKRLKSETLSIHNKWLDDIPFPHDFENSVLGLVGARRFTQG